MGKSGAAPTGNGPSGVLLLETMPRPLKSDLEALLREEPYVRALARVLAAGHEDEIVQQTWLQACEHRGRPVDKPRAWLGTIVRNVTRNLLRRESRQEQRKQDARERQPRTAAPSSVELMQREERRRNLVAMIDTLPSDQRDVMLLRYFEGLPPREIAARLDLTAGTVWNLHRRALERLRKALDDTAHKRGESRAAYLLPLATGPWTLPAPATAATTAATGATTTSSSLAPLPAGLLAGSLAITMKTKLLAATAVVFAIALAIYWPDTPVPAPTSNQTGGAQDASAANADLPQPGATGSVGSANVREQHVADADSVDGANLGSLEVTVRFGGDTPAPAAGATITYRTLREDRRLAARATTDAQGKVRIDDLPPGRFYVHADRHGRGKRVEVEAGQTAEVEIVYAAGMQLRGLVVDENARPIAGAQIETAMPMLVGRDPEVLAVSDADGRFTIRDAFRPCLVGARAEGFLASKMQMAYASVGSEVDLEFVLVRGGGTVAGVVVDDRGRPIANALVCVGEGDVQGLGGGTLQDSDPLPALVRSGADGTFRALSVPAGEAPVWARAADMAPWSGTCSVADFGTSGLRITMQRGGAIRGVVRKPDGSPAPKAEVLHGSWQATQHIQTYCDEQGAFEIRGLPVGAVVMRAEHDDEGKVQETLTLASGAVLEHDFVLSRGLEVRGRVTDQDGNPVAKVSVEATAERTPKAKHWMRYTRTDEDGRYAITNCPIDRAIDVEFSSKPIEPRRIRDYDPRKGPLDITVRKIGSDAYIVGRVVGPDGKPIAGVRISPRCDARSQHLSPFTTKQDGTFSFGPIPEGVWLVSMSHEAHPSRTIESHQLGGSERWDMGDVAMELGGSAVIKPQSVPGKDLYFMIADTRSSARWSMLPANEPVTPILRPGDYLLQAWGKRAAAQVVKFTILAGQRIEIPLHTEAGHKQHLEFTYDRERETTYGATLAVYRGNDKIVDRWLSTKPGEDWSYDLWLLPGTYRVTMSGKLRAETSLTIGDEEPEPRTLELTRR